MATITSERQKQLVELYENLKKDLLEIEGKYSPDSRKITIDFPPTLGLTKLTYTRHTQAELLEMAHQQITAKYKEKNRILDNSYASNVRSVEYARSLLDVKLKLDVLNLENNFNNTIEELNHKIVDNGLWYSTVKDEVLARETALRDQKREYLDTNVLQKDIALVDKLTSLKEAYQKSKTELDSQRIAEAVSVAQTLATKEEKEARAVEKYNTSLDEKEAKYQANCQRYLRYAQQAEEERVIAILKLYAQLGASGVEQRKLSEMLSYCQSELSVCTKGEAEYIFALDSFLQAHLGIYYSALVDWARLTLRPD